MFDFWAKTGIATFSLARIQRQASADDCTIFRNICDKHWWSQTRCSKRGKEGGKVYIRGTSWRIYLKKMPRPVKNIHSFFGPCQHTITLQTPTNNDSKPCQFHTKLEEFSFQRQAKCTSQLHPGNIKTKKCQRKPSPNLAPSCRSAVFSWGPATSRRLSSIVYNHFRNFGYLFFLGIFERIPYTYQSIYCMFVCKYILCK